MDTQPTDWTRASHELEEAWTKRAAEFAPETIMNAREFLAILEEQNRALPLVSDGYWPTISFTWTVDGAENLEIEVFAERFEVYRFSANRTDIRYEYRTPGELFPSTLLAEVPLLTALSGR